MKYLVGFVDGTTVQVEAWSAEFRNETDNVRERGLTFFDSPTGAGGDGDILAFVPYEQLRFYSVLKDDNDCGTITAKEKEA